MSTARKDPDLELAAAIADFYDDPLGHVLFSYPWGEGALRGREGPEEWQADFLVELGDRVRERGFDGVDAVDPIRFSTSSGHGIGKSTLVSWLIRWIMDTRPHCKGVVTAMTNIQLRTKTWAELAKWHSLGITKHWYQLNAGGGSLNLYHKAYPETWRVDAQTCEERNSEAFAGLHAASSTPFYIFDEASGVPDKIFEVREGGLTDGEPMVFDFGNPTRNSGRFHQNMVGRYREQYSRRFIDSRDVSITNKRLIERWRETWGEDSDFFKVRVKGEFPDQSSLQFISGAMVDECVDLEVHVTPADPLVIGVDVARFGDDSSVIWVRRGRDCESVPAQVFHGLDTMQLASRLAKLAMELRPDAVFVDGGGVGGGVIDRARQLGVDVTEVNFGAKPSQKGYADMRAQCWGNLKDAMSAGIRLPDDDDLYQDLVALEYSFTKNNDIRLESKEDAKKRGIASPDRADALALCYAYPVFPSRPGYDGLQFATAEHDYDPMAD